MKYYMANNVEHATVINQRHGSGKKEVSLVIEYK